MAIYHFSGQIISRSVGRSAVAASAYRAAQKIVDNRTGQIHDFTKKVGVDYSKILLPKNAPTDFSDPNLLWNEVEKIEKRKDAQVAREFNVALPIELNNEQKKELALDFVNEQFVKIGMIAQLDLHDIDSNNPHFHVMLTTRHVSSDGFGAKNRDWNSKDLLKKWREAWADTANKHLQKAGVRERIDHRTLAEQCVNRAPQIHLGQDALGFEKRNGRASELRKKMEQQQLEHLAQQAAKSKIEDANAFAIQAAQQVVKKISVALALETEKLVEPTQPSSLLRRELAQVLEGYRPATVVVSERPEIKQAKAKVSKAKQQLELEQMRYAELEALVPAAKKEWGKAKRAVEQWRAKHPVRLWLHERVSPSSTLRRLEEQLEDAGHSINAARSSAKLAKQDVERSLSIYIKHRDEHISMQSEAVQALNEQRKPTDLLIRRLEQALRGSEQREQQEQERITALQQEQERRNKLGVVLTPNSNVTTRAKRQTPKF